MSGSVAIAVFIQIQLTLGEILSEKDGLLSFLSHMWGKEESKVYLSLKPEPDVFINSSPLGWPSEAEKIVGNIFAYDAQGKDVYFSPATYVDKPTGKNKESAKQSRILVVDLDGYKDGQSAPEAALLALEAAGLPQPTYRIQSSQKAAEHWYWILDNYYLPKEVENVNRQLAYFLNADKACWNIDHVFRPPFTHNHKPLRKNSDGSAPGVTIAYFNREAFSLERFSSLPPIKEQIKDIIRFGNIPPIEDVMAKYHWDNTHLEIFKNDKPLDRSNSMVRLSYFCAEVGMSDEAMYAVINDVDIRWQKFVGRHDREKQIADIINKARVKYPSDLFEVETTTTEVMRPVVFGINDFLKAEFKFDWIFENLIPKSSINALASRPGVGKSRITLQLARSLATGTDFLGYKNCMGGPIKTMFISLEMGGPVLMYFIESLVGESDMNLEEVNEMFRLVPQGEAMSLTTPDGIQFFDYLIEEEKPEFVIIDAMSSLAFEDLNEKVSKAIMTKLKQTLNKHNVTFLLLHHNKKANEMGKDKPPTLDDFYGNTFGTTDLATVMALWKPPGQKYTEFHAMKTRIGASPKPLILNGVDQFTFKIESEQEEEIHVADGKESPSLEFGFGSMAGFN
ncbi:DNA primase/helicase [Arthrobacter phage Casserole]|nr:DNA primase/helicase [Arthrobacter phage Casserole]